MQSSVCNVLLLLFCLSCLGFNISFKVKTFLCYQEERQLNPGTMSNHVTSILYAVKYIHRDHAPKYTVPIIQQLRSVATQLQKEGDRIRPKTCEELEQLGKWVSW